jgi:hypothetical protein
MRRPAVPLALGVLSLAILVLPPAASAARQPVRALVLRDATSPVLGELRAQLGANLRVKRATSRRLRQSRRYRLLIVDGDTFSPAELARRRRAINRYMNRRGWVLALDVRRGHFARALDRLTRLSVRPAIGGRSARVFLFRHALVGRVPATVTLRAPRLNPMGSQQLPPSGREKALADNTARIAGLVRARLLRPGAGLPPAPTVRLTSGGDGIPAEALHKLWLHTEAGSLVPKPAYFTASTPPPLGVTPPTPGSQTVTWTMNHQFDAYLDNSPSHPDGNFQVVTYDLDGQLAPKKSNEKFQYMDDQFQVGAGYLNLERAWWTGLVDVSVTPDAATDGKLTWQGNAPATPNEETTYSSGQEFEVGISATEEGPALSASYTVNNETEHTVPDWGVVSDSSGNDLDWEFSARNACDVRPTSTPAACAGSNLLPVRPNELSLGNLSVATSGRWRTKEPLEPPNGTLAFTLDTPVTLADTVCPYYGILECDQRWGIFVDTIKTGPPAINYTLDASDVVPVGLKPLTLSPNPADGASNQPVTGTITLERPAPVQTNVKVFSDDANATLPLPVQGAPDVTQDSVTIPEGESSATFRINTNNNDLPKGATETADITAFYTEPTVAQLRVKG